MTLSEEIAKNLPKIENLLSKDTLKAFAQTPEDLLGKYLAGLGTVVRLKLLCDHNALYRAFLKEGFTDRDEMTLIILREFRKHLLARPSP